MIATDCFAENCSQMNGFCTALQNKLSLKFLLYFRSCSRHDLKYSRKLLRFNYSLAISVLEKSTADILASILFNYMFHQGVGMKFRLKWRALFSWYVGLY